MHRQTKQQTRGEVSGVDELTQQIEQPELNKAKRGRGLNQEKVEADNHNAIATQIRQLIELNRIPGDEGETVYNFADGKNITRIYVSNETRKQLINGRFAIVRGDDEYEVVPRKVAEKIMQRDAGVVVLYHEKIHDEEGDDTHSEIRVPDDLMW